MSFGPQEGYRKPSWNHVQAQEEKEGDSEHETCIR